MKLIKKIAAIMFAFVMVFSLSTNAMAADSATGTITIENAKKGETYTVYRVLTLDSYDAASGRYSYLPANDAWKTYFEGAGNKYMKLNKDGYVETKYNDSNAQELAQALIKQAKEIAKTDKTYSPIKKQVTADGDLNISSLPLGYYVIDSTVGTLCALNTTNPNATISPKHVQPTVVKQIFDEAKQDYVTQNSANIGDILTFETTINVKKGAKNYVLHDKMHSGLTFVQLFDVHDNFSDAKKLQRADWTVSTKTTDGCTFEIKFNQEYFDRINQDAEIRVKYHAMVNENAPIKTAMENKTWLTYGDAQKTDEKITKTYTFGIPVFKYTGINTPLKGAKFILSTDPNCQDSEKTLKFTKNSGDKYRYDNTNGKTELVSLDSGRIDIEGIKAGTYYLKETAAPKGYNLLKAVQKIEILDDGSIKLNNEAITGDVGVKNNSGSLLPSTGGAGTIMFYLIGGALVIGSGFVLANKKRAKAK